MEPGHEDREYSPYHWSCMTYTLPQWSPVMKTGNTTRKTADELKVLMASMEPGHEDREYWRTAPIVREPLRCLNGARS